MWVFYFEEDSEGKVRLISMDEEGMDEREKFIGFNDCVSLGRRCILVVDVWGVELMMLLYLNGELEERFICYGRMKNLGCFRYFGNKDKR